MSNAPTRLPGDAEPLPDPWNHPEEAFRRLRKMAELRNLALSLHKAGCAALGRPDKFTLEHYIARTEPSVHDIPAEEVFSPGEIERLLNPGPGKG